MEWGKQLVSINWPQLIERIEAMHGVTDKSQAIIIVNVRT